MSSFAGFYLGEVPPSSPHRQARRVNEYESLACHLGQYEARQQLAWGSDMAVCIVIVFEHGFFW